MLLIQVSFHFHNDDKYVRTSADWGAGRQTDRQTDKRLWNPIELQSWWSVCRCARLSKESSADSNCAGPPQCFRQYYVTGSCQRLCPSSRVITACTWTEEPFLADATVMHYVKQDLVTRSDVQRISFWAERWSRQTDCPNHNFFITFVYIRTRFKFDPKFLSHRVNKSFYPFHTRKSSRRNLRLQVHTCLISWNDSAETVPIHVVVQEKQRKAGWHFRF